MQKSVTAVSVNARFIRPNLHSPSLLIIVISFLAGFIQPVTANVLEDRDSLLTLLGNSVACRLSEELMVDMPVSALFSNDTGDCEGISDADDFDSLSSLFSDASCQTPMVFDEIPQQLFCLLALDKEILGEGGGLPVQPAHPEWSLSPGSLYDVGAASSRGLTQPYMQRVSYKQVETAAGTCNLEMRIYKNTISETGLKPMVALHGGSWRARGFGFFGLEMTIPRFTQQNYVVFAPFYRLLDAKESTPACHNATISEVREDAADAMRWVIENAALYGASDYPTVFGQSAGAHLATSLAVEFPEQVANAVLFYPPTDFTEFALRVQDGSYTDEQGLDILEAVMGATAEEIDVSQSPIPENTFPVQVLENPSRYPPMFTLHGLADELVEATQSTRLCGALGGNLDAVPGRQFWLQQGNLRDVLDCDDRGSELHLLREGDHALDVCLTGNQLLNDLCLSGSSESRTLVADSVNSAASWAASTADARATEREELLQAEIDANNTGNEQPVDGEGEGESGTAGETDAAGEESGGSRSGGSGASSLAWLFCILGLLAFRFPRGSTHRL